MLKFLAIILGLSLPAGATITLQFSDFGSALTGLSDSNGGSGVNGLAWGILVDTTGDGIPGGASAPELVGDVGLNLNDGIDLGAGDLFFYGGDTVAIGGPDGGDGGVSTANNMDPYSFAGQGVSAGDTFYLIWFDTGTGSGDSLPPGTQFGLLEDAAFLLPADGTGTTSYQSNFSGEDPIRAAEFALVPEPSSLLIGLLSALGLLRRRR